jgi:hypothetical protein
MSKAVIAIGIVVVCMAAYLFVSDQSLLIGKDEVKFRGLVQGGSYAVSPPLTGVIWWDVKVNEITADPDHHLTLNQVVRVREVISPPLPKNVDSQARGLNSVDVYGVWKDSELSINGPIYYFTIFYLTP